MIVAYWEDGEVVVLPYDSARTNNVLWVEDLDGNIICGHDHYWFENDGSIGYADHHNYDEEGWPMDTCWLPDDRSVLNGIYLPDEVWEKVRPW